MSDPLQSYYTKREQEALSGKVYLLGLLPVLKEAGALKLTIPYDGSGDSGEVDSPVVTQTFLDDERTITVPGLDNEAIIEAAYQVLERAQGGWEINEGSWGQIVLYVSSGKLMIEHNQRFEDSEYSESEA
jgi:hypothetical protein